MYFTETAFLAKDSVKVMQEKKLQELLAYLGQHSRFYQELFEAHRIEPGRLRRLDDLAQIPVTTKEDLQERNKDFLCVGREKIIEYTSTSGTLGSPVTIALTEKDLDRLAYNEYSSFLCAD